MMELVKVKKTGRIAPQERESNENHFSRENSKIINEFPSSESNKNYFNYGGEFESSPVHLFYLYTAVLFFILLSLILFFVLFDLVQAKQHNKLMHSLNGNATTNIIESFFKFNLKTENSDDSDELTQNYQKQSSPHIDTFQSLNDHCRRCDNPVWACICLTHNDSNNYQKALSELKQLKKIMIQRNENPNFIKEYPSLHDLYLQKLKKQRQLVKYFKRQRNLQRRQQREQSHIIKFRRQDERLPHSLFPELKIMNSQGYALYKQRNHNKEMMSIDGNDGWLAINICGIFIYFICYFLFVHFNPTAIYYVLYYLLKLLNQAFKVFVINSIITTIVLVVLFNNLFKLENQSIHFMYYYIYFYSTIMYVISRFILLNIAYINALARQHNKLMHSLNGNVYCSSSLDIIIYLQQVEQICPLVFNLKTINGIWAIDPILSKMSKYSARYVITAYLKQPLSPMPREVIRFQKRTIFACNCKST